MKQNKSFIKLMDAYAFEIAKGTMAPDDKFDVKIYKQFTEIRRFRTRFYCKRTFESMEGS